MKKFLLAILAAVCAACLGLAAACAHEPEYYTLTFPATAGVTYDFGELKHGMLVKEGYNVTFKVEFSETVKNPEEATVKANDTVLTALEDGTYSFVMEKDTKVTVEGLNVSKSCKIEFDSDNPFVNFYSADDGKKLTVLEGITEGKEIKFNIKVSVYYKQDVIPKVLAGTEEIPADNGVYTLKVNGNTKVSVNGLVQDDGFTLRNKIDFPNDYGGAGTEEDPFIISRPVDLFYMASLVNDPMHSGRFSTAHYKMANDIDLKGEQLYVTGDGTSSTAFFGGSFDGCGYTVSNFRIEDSFVEQTDFNEVFQPLLGFFGLVAPSSANPKPVVIKNLNLKDFTMVIDSAVQVKEQFWAGGILAQGLGVNVINCSVNGEISATADPEQLSFIGGIAGYLQSNTDGNGKNMNSFIESCSSEVNIAVQSGNVYAAGGVVGWLYSVDENASAYVLNSSYTGDVYGALASGGIAGRVNNYSFIGGCYATGNVGAYNDLKNVGSEEYRNAYAGGIAGLAEYCSVISDCFAVCETSATATVDKYEYADDLVGLIDDSASVVYVETFAAGVYNSWSPAGGFNANGEAVKVNLTINDEFIKNTLKWKETEWTFGNGYPKAVYPEEKSCVVTLNIDGVTHQTRLNEYDTLSNLYGNAFEKYLTKDGKTTFGYYFDQQLTRKVPAGFVPARGEVTLYASYADYGEIAGKYYIRNPKTGSGAYILLNADGTFYYSNGALSFTSEYVYDGNEILINPSPMFAERVIVDYVQENGQTVPVYGIVNFFAKATVGNGELSFIDGKLELTDSASYFPGRELKTVKEIENFKYGNYYFETSEYLFYSDGVVSINGNAYDYTCKDGVIEISDGKKGTLNNGTVTVEGNALTAYDQYYGVWEKSATTHERYTFNGKGGYSYKSFGYESGSQAVEKEFASDSGTYASDGVGGIVLSSEGVTNGYRAGLNAEGYLSLNNGVYNENYYKENSLVGLWRFHNKNEPIELQLLGLLEEGYGNAVWRYPNSNRTVNVTYHVNEGNIMVYNGDALYAELSYSPVNATLAGRVYTQSGTWRNGALFCLYDDFSGVWISEIGTINFNGFGAYYLAGGATYLKVEGLITVNGVAAGNYRLEKYKAEGVFQYEGKTYSITYNPATKAVDIKVEDKQFSAIALDGWNETVLSDYNGNTYSFNGGGNLEQGGIMTAGDKQYVYKLNGGEATLYSMDGAEAGSIVPAGDCYTLTLNGSAKLYVENNMTGEWLTQRGSLIIGKIGSDMTASGRFAGKTVTFDYDVKEKTLSFIDGKETFVISAFSSDEEGLSLTGEVDAFVALKTLDAVEGTYVSDNGSIVLDGFGGTEFTRGVATFKNKSGATTGTYVYTVSEKGVAEIYYNRISVLAPLQKQEEGCYVLDGKYYALVKVDLLYNSSATVETDKSVQFEFDGMGTAVSTKGETYSYGIIYRDYVALTLTMLYVKDGEAYVGTLNYVINDYTMTAPDRTIIETNLDGVIANDKSGGETFYKFDAESGTVVYGDMRYSFEIISCDKENLTVTMKFTEGGNRYDAVLDYSNGSFVLDLNKITATAA